MLCIYSEPSIKDSPNTVDPNSLPVQISESFGLVNAYILKEELFLINAPLNNYNGCSDL